MTEPFFRGIERIRYEGPDSENPLAFRYYDARRSVLGKPMREQLRFAVCYWHTLCWPGSDVFGAGTFDRPWFQGRDAVSLAEHKLRVAFELFEKLGVPFFTFHDRDIAPELASLRETNAALDRLLEQAQAEMSRTGVRLLWGTANLFGHPRYMAGAATNPDPEVFAFAAAQVKHMLEWTHRLGGENYVLWGGREGYETLLNTDLRRELDQLGRFLALVAEHKHKLGFRGTLLIEPKPMEPTKHQYDFDVASVLAFLQRYDLEREFKVNIEVNHATLAGHTFHHEVCYALANDILGSIDINRGDTLLGWDTDQFPTDLGEVILALYEIQRAGGLSTGGLNFDAKLRRQSIEPDDLFHAHIGGMDTLARALLGVERMIADGKLETFRAQRYEGYDGELGRRILGGNISLEELAEHAVARGHEPRPRSGRQELLENLVNRYF